MVLGWIPPGRGWDRSLLPVAMAILTLPLRTRMVISHVASGERVLGPQPPLARTAAVSGPVFHAPVECRLICSGTGPVIAPLKINDLHPALDTALTAGLAPRMGGSSLLLRVIVLLWATESRSTRIKRLRSNGWTGHASVTATAS